MIKIKYIHSDLFHTVLFSSHFFAQRGETPMHLAARSNQIDLIKLLLRHNATVDAKAHEKQTPLHIAARLGNVEIVDVTARKQS